MSRRRGATPLLVTGLPRSGTTWLAQLLARGPSASMLGREPMNPRTGQFALGGEAREWTRWSHASPRAQVLLRRTYGGREPRTYGRLGVRQWRAALPGTRVVVKDPFALLSLPAVVEASGARPVVVYRSADAMLASYRRMGWRPDLAELVTLGADVPPGADTDDALGMAVFWSWAHQCLLEDLATIPEALLVSHAELTAGGLPARRRLFMRLGLDPSYAADREPVSAAHGGARVEEDRLHNLDRSAAEVLGGWQRRLEPEERSLLLARTAEVGARLDEARYRLVG